MSSVIVRSFDDILDSGFIYGTWPKSVYYSGINIDPDSDKRTWFEQFHAYMKQVLPEATILIACMQDDPGTILGYSIIYGKMLQFAYVKELFRKQGIASLLLKRNKLVKDVETNPSFITRVGLAIISEHPEVFKQEESKEEHEESTSHN